jgi:hypothetical protein
MPQTNGSPDFPTTDEYVDFAGQRRRFKITLHELPLGYSVDAVEEVEGDDHYEFRAFSPTSPFHALYDLRKKIPKLLSTRHLVKKDGRLSTTYDRLRGRIACGGVVVDGIFLTFEQLADLVQTHEGFQFDLKLVDSCDELE